MIKARFSRLSTRIGLAAAAVAIATGLVISVAGYFGVRHQEDKARTAFAQQHVREQARRIADRVDVMTSALRLAVKSSLIASALVDSAGKELYVQPFLNRLSVYPGMTASIYFVDYEGRVEMHSDGALPLTAGQAWMERTIAAGREVLHLEPSGDGGSLHFVTPLIFERTGRPEGALVAQVRLKDLVFLSGTELRIAQGADAPVLALQEAAVPVEARLLHPEATLVLHDKDLSRELDHTFGSGASEVLALGLALSLAIALLLARPVARRTLRDVDRLVAELRALDTRDPSQRQQVAEVGSEEIRSIARAVNTMLADLESSSRDYRRERELRMAGIIESSTDAIITLDAGHRIVQFNAAAAQMFRIPAEEAIGSTVDRFVPPQQREHHEELIRTFQSSGEVPSRRMGRARAFRALRADGDTFQAEATLTKARIDGQDYMTVLIRDITDQVVAEGERAARAVAEAANKEKTAFLARMSHELRTPLNAIHGFADLMLRQRQPVSQAQLRERLELIVGSSRRLLALINDLLDVSRIELGALQVQVSAIDAAQVVRGAVVELEEMAGRAGIDLRIGLPDGPLWAMADQGRLHQVMSNLISNAVKYNRPGGSVGITAAQDGERLRIEVRDTGLGMSEDQLASLYQPFNRLGRDNQAQGAGIGLTIARHLVQVMGGEIEVSSQPGQGTCFSVVLACSQAPAGEPAGVGEAEPLELRFDVTGRVFYIEDDPINQMLLQSCMELRPAVDLTVIDTGGAAIEAVLRDPPDLLLVDMMLPDMNGIELGLALRARLGERCPKMIAYSANAQAENIEAAREAGFVEYLLKPTPTDDLFAVVDRLLAESRSRRKNLVEPG